MSCLKVYAAENDSSKSGYDGWIRVSEPPADWLEPADEYYIPLVSLTAFDYVYTSALYLHVDGKQVSFITNTPNKTGITISGESIQGASKVYLRTYNTVYTLSESLVFDRMNYELTFDVNSHYIESLGASPITGSCPLYRNQISISALNIRAKTIFEPSLLLLYTDYPNYSFDTVSNVYWCNSSTNGTNGTNYAGVYSVTFYASMDVKKTDALLGALQGMQQGIDGIQQGINDQIAQDKKLHDETMAEMKKEHEETKGLLGSIIEGITNLPGKIRDLFSDLLKALFIPGDDFLTEKIETLKDQILNGLGFLGYPVVWIADVIDVIFASDQGGLSIAWPAIEFPALDGNTYTILKAGSFDLEESLESDHVFFDMTVSYVRLGTSIILFVYICIQAINLVLGFFGLDESMIDMSVFADINTMDAISAAASEEEERYEARSADRAYRRYLRNGGKKL